MKYRIGDRILVSQELQEVGPYLIVGLLSPNEYVVLFDKGWEIVYSNLRKYCIDAKYIGQKAWVVSEKQIVQPIEYFGIKAGCFPMLQPQGLN